MKKNNASSGNVRSAILIRLCQLCAILLLLLCCPHALSAKKNSVTLTKRVLLDKIKGGWAGQTIGCAYGGPHDAAHRRARGPRPTQRDAHA